METELTDSYQYQFLDNKKDQIRILHALPTADENAQLKFSLEVVDLDDGSDTPFYEAISYTWGTSSVLEHITIDDQTLQIPLNTARALRCICYQHRHRRVWIDAVCINQSDIPERSSQVQMMSQVYSKAHAVLVWLDDDPASYSPLHKSQDRGGSSKVAGELPLQALLTLESTCAGIVGPGWRKLVSKPFRLTILQALHSPALLSVSLSTLEPLFTHVWFSRAWVVQELALARSAQVYQARLHAPWGLLSVMMAIAYLKHKAEPIRFKETCGCFYRGILISAIREMVKDKHGLAEEKAEVWGNRTIELSSLSLLAHRFDSRVPRDKIYAFLSLAARSGKVSDEILKVDYAEEVGLVYASAVKACLRQSAKDGIALEVLPACAQWNLEKAETARMGSSSLPSWARNFDQKIYRHFIEACQAGLACGNLTFLLEETGDVRELALVGVETGAIEHIAPFDRAARLDLANNERGDTIWEALKDILKHYKWLRDLVPGLEMVNFIKSTWETYYHSINTQWYTPLIASPEIVYRLVANAALGENHEPTAFVFDENLPDHADIVTQVVYMLRTLSQGLNCFPLFVTDSKKLGYGVQGMESGDRVCVIGGERLPVILRPCGNRWTWIGKAYIPDLADGSYIHGLEKRGVLEQETQTFVVI